MTNQLINDTKQKSSKMAELLEQEKDAMIVPQIGELIEGIVVSIGKNEVILDINGIHTGAVRGKEILDESGDASNLKIGDKIAATVLELDNENGELELSFRFAGHQKAWENLEKLQSEGEIVEAKIIDANKGGLMIKVGNVLGFLPVSQLTTEHYPRVEGGDKNKILVHLKSYCGQGFRVKIIDVNEAEEKLIVSEKAAWEEKQQSAISKYKVGDKVDGTITGVVDFGAFVEFGENLEGLIHISELAWQRIDNPRDIIHVGDKVKASIIAIENAKISLSLKKLQTDPWAEVAKKYKVGQSIKGKVLKTNPFGAFVELDNDIHGLAHISELSEKEISNPTDVVEIGESYKFTIISIEPNEHRLGLSMINKKKASKEDVEKEDTKKDEEVKEVPSEEKKEEVKEETTNDTKNEEKVKEEKVEEVKTVADPEQSRGEEEPTKKVDAKKDDTNEESTNTENKEQETKK
jgi:small subunit ribosomal protein S1